MFGEGLGCGYVTTFIEPNDIIDFNDIFEVTMLKNVVTIDYELYLGGGSSSQLAVVGMAFGGGQLPFDCKGDANFMMIKIVMITVLGTPGDIDGA